jgi:hypothetical protein
VEIGDRPEAVCWVEEQLDGSDLRALVTTFPWAPLDDLLRQIYGEQIVLIGSQGTVQQREANLMPRAITSASQEEKVKIVRDLIELDAERDPISVWCCLRCRSSRE